MTTLTAKAEAAKNVFATAAVNYSTAKAEALSKADSSESQDEKALFAKTAKTALTHERYSEALASMSDKALAVMSKYKVDPEALSTQSRELKKRSIAILEALANKQHVNDIALDAVLQYIAHKDASAMTLDQVQHQMQHKTTTQAQYFKTCAIFFNFATYSKSEKTINLNKDASVLRDLLAIYNKADA